MLYVICGPDEKKSSQKFSVLTDQLLSRQADLTLFRVDGDNFDSVQFEEFIFSHSLFDKKYVVACRRLLENKLAEELIASHLASIAQSPHIFIFLERQLPTQLAVAINQHAEKVQVFKTKEEKKTTAFNIFSLGDALSTKDRKKLWIVFSQALYFGVPTEDIFWQFARTVKNILLVKKTSDPKTLNLHPFVLKKTLGVSNNFSVEELTELSGQLTVLFHAVRDGRQEMDIALEKFVLGV